MITTKLIDARKDPDFREEEGGRWITFCVRHGAFVQHTTRAVAKEFLGCPEEYCDRCREERESIEARLRMQRKLQPGDMEVLLQLAKVVKQANERNDLRILEADEIKEVLMWAEVASGARQIIYHIQKERGLDLTDVWTGLDI